jgi:hypothetical protein
MTASEKELPGRLALLTAFEMWSTEPTKRWWNKLRVVSPSFREQRDATPAVG